MIKTDKWEAAAHVNTVAHYNVKSYFVLETLKS